MEKILDIRPIKAKLRGDLKKKRVTMPERKKTALDMKIQNKLMNLWAFRQADTILTYVSTPVEVDTKRMIKAAFSMGKTVAVPRCETYERQMNFYLIKSLNELAPGAFGVLEPLSIEHMPFDNFKNSLCVVPGLSFDKHGYRLGYGKGYYDRFLRNYTGTTVGICYEDNIKERLPHGKYDVAVQMLITEKEVYSID
ncbi:MAG: 5-formyltetrahydrofolate cyclo-ligase [Clostridiales bacterium]|nr:5-formyltetrahydrofolate cyclo-ligase [Clostridiales bacterium]